MEGSEALTTEDAVLVEPGQEAGAPMWRVPLLGDMAGPDAQVQSEPQPEEPPKPEPESAEPFDEKYKLPFEGLLFLGYKRSSFHWMGHRFAIRTLSTDDLLEVGLLHEQYKDSMADQKAFQALYVTAALDTVDDQPLPIPLTLDPSDTALEAKFAVVRRWAPFVIDEIYTKVVELESEVVEVLNQMGKA